MFFLSFIAAFLPVVVYIIVLRWLDRYEPEPIKNIILMFVLGAVFSTGISFLANTAMRIVSSWVMTESGGEYLSTALVAPLIEEVNKGLIVLLLALMSREFDNLTDGIIYGAVVGLGFAFAENVYYFVNIYETDGVFSWLDHVYTRGLYTVAVHACSTSIFGACVGATRYYKVAERFLVSFIGLMLAVMVHSFWNSLLTVASFSQDPVLSILPFLAIPLIFFFLFVILQFSLYRESQIIEQELQLEAKEGLFPAEHVGVLKSYFARSHAVFFGGRVNAKAYIETATEIAFRRNQFGIASPKMKTLLASDLVTLRERMHGFIHNQKGGIGLTALMVFFILTVFTGVLALKPIIWQSLIEDFPATKEARLFLQHHPDLAVWVGPDLQLGKPESGDFRYDAFSGEGEMTFPVTGKSASGKISLTLTSPDGSSWIINDAKLSLKGENDPRRMTVSEDWLKFAEDALAQNNLSEARSDCALIHVSAPEDAIGDYCDARILYQDGHADEALKTLETLASQKPKDVYPQAILAETYYNFGELEKSLATYLKVYELKPEARYAALIAGLYLDLGKGEAGFGWMAKAKEVDGAVLEYCYGKYYKLKGETEKAISAFELAIAQDESFSSAYFALADIYVEKHDPMKAAYYLERGVVMNPVDSGRQRKALVDLLIRQGESDLAVYHLIKAISFDPNDIGSYVRLAALYTNFGRQADAESTYQMASDLDAAATALAWREVWKNLMPKQ